MDNHNELRSLEALIFRCNELEQEVLRLRQENAELRKKTEELECK